MKLVLLIGLVQALMYTTTAFGVIDFPDIPGEIELDFEEEEVFDDTGVEEAAEMELLNSEEPDISNFPEEFDFREHGIMHGAINQGSTCSSCAYVAGTQTLEARIGHASENYLAYSIQAFMNCKQSICKAGMPTWITSYAMQTDFINLEDEIPYTKRYCIYQAPNRTACDAECGYTHPDEYTNALDDQFVVIAGSRAARTEAEIIAALQGGPLTTSFRPKKAEPGERCSPGWGHINSIVGYTREKWILQESYGKRWGGNNDGSWRTTRGSICGNGIMKRAFYPNIVYDYDRANAYYTEISEGVNEADIQFLEVGQYGIITNTTRNWGTSKNKCAFLGKICKGVVERSNGQYGLVESWGSEENIGGEQRAFQKTQMVVYLKHDESGQYIKILKKRRGKLVVDTTGKKEQADPFFLSYNRLISYRNPQFHLVDKKLEKIPAEGSIKAIDVMKAWNLEDCNIYNSHSGNSFDIVGEEGKDGETKYTLGASPYDPESPSQKFGVGLSAKWMLISSHLDLPLANFKGTRYFSRDSDGAAYYMRWNGRQVMTPTGKAVTPTGSEMGPDFEFGLKEYEFERRHCVITKLIKDPYSDGNNLNLENGKLVMGNEKNSHWTLEQGEL